MKSRIMEKEKLQNMKTNELAIRGFRITEEELKTLKDISCAVGYCCEDIEYAVEIHELKAEAVKWFKLPNDGLGYDPYCCADSIRNFIKKFFNLTEEDLE